MLRPFASAPGARLRPESSPRPPVFGLPVSGPRLLAPRLASAPVTRGSDASFRPGASGRAWAFSGAWSATTSTADHAPEKASCGPRRRAGGSARSARKMSRGFSQGDQDSRAGFRDQDLEVRLENQDFEIRSGTLQGSCCEAAGEVGVRISRSGCRSRAGSGR